MKKNWVKPQAIELCVDMTARDKKFGISDGDWMDDQGLETVS
ncbi:MAG: hypothetical protein AAGU32_16115 [Bacillota bacterium]